MRHRLRTYLVAGLLVILPLGVTVLVLLALFRFLDSLLAPVFQYLLQRRVPGLGLVAGIIMILFTGAFASNVLGRRVVGLFDYVIMRIPIVRTIYSAIRQLTDSVFMQNRSAFKGAVLVEWPRQGLYSVGFVTGETSGEAARGERILNVFMMHTPNPTTGILCLVPESQVIPLEMSVEAALKLVVSGGIVAPPLRARADEPSTPGLPLSPRPTPDRV
ncbi:MAG: DUF502 domain-containing protein [Armatimonadota bacterium]